jgi:flagellar hook capping protein FlgD
MPLFTRGAFLLIGLLAPAIAGAELFDFDTAPYRSALPIDQTVGGITAHFSATGQGFSIQRADEMGFTPAGFGGLCIYPSSVFAADLVIDFSVTVTALSILYAPQELGCDDSAIMRVTAYMDGVSRGWSTTTAPQPGTWPTGTLSYSDAAGFNRVVVHYDQRPLCGDWGPIFMADNMSVTPAVTTTVSGLGSGSPTCMIAPNPFHSATEVRMQLARAEMLSVTVHDVAGRLVRTLARGARFEPGAGSIGWDGRDDAGHEVRSGVYLCRIASESGVRITPMILRR